jgi:chromosome segregation ATPase
MLRALLAAPRTPAPLTLLLAACALVPAARAQEAPPAQQLLAEAQRIQATLTRVQAKALEAPPLARAADRLVADVEARMAELEPATSQRLERIEALRVQVEAAQAERDPEAFEKAIGEARTLTEALEATRARVLGEEAFATRASALQEQLVEAMTAIEPRVPQLIARVQEIGLALSGPAPAGP